MIKCEHCKRIFDNNEIITERQYMGEFWGSPAYDDFDVCPYCKSDEIFDYEEEEEDD
jgi:RNA polymerase subunit RPABC4/transcription elongation factor Spt4